MPVGNRTPYSEREVPCCRFDFCDFGALSTTYESLSTTYEAAINDLEKSINDLRANAANAQNMLRKKLSFIFYLFCYVLDIRTIYSHYLSCSTVL